jgi:hypothetical protein
LTPFLSSSLLLQCAQRLASIPGVTLLQLQEDVENLGQRGIRTLDSMLATEDDRLVATAAAMRNLNVVLCVDNLIAHLGGAMGVATWLLLPVAPEPWWMQTGESSPWYPTMRLFRQRRREDWEEVILRIYHELRRRCD